MYKYICSENTSPYYNLALERSLFDFVDEDTVILYLWQNSHTIVIGKNQNAYAECKVDEFIGAEVHLQGDLQAEVQSITTWAI